MNLKTLLRGVLCTALAFAAASVSAKADDYPSRVIQIICPSAPGGGSDVLARLIARELEAVAGKRVIVINKPGAGGLLGTRALIGADPDGYSLFIHAGTAVVGNAHVLRAANYDPHKDMIPIAPVSRIGWALVVGESSPAHTVADLIRLLKDKKGEATFASPNNATTAATALFEKATGVKTSRVAYRAVTDAILDVAAGRIDFTFADIALAVPQAEGKRIRILAVTTPDRATVDKSYPTMMEAGVPGYQYTSYFGMWAPAGTPKPIVDKLNEWMQKIGNDPKVQETIVRSGFDPMTGSSADLAKLVSDDSNEWAALVKSGTIEVQ
jgi:tripartite-type tricarboxylate transporter receptor subunit TctC